MCLACSCTSSRTNVRDGEWRSPRALPTVLRSSPLALSSAAAVAACRRRRRARCSRPWRRAGRGDPGVGDGDHAEPRVLDLATHDRRHQLPHALRVPAYPGRVRHLAHLHGVLLPGRTGGADAAGPDRPTLNTTCVAAACRRRRHPPHRPAARPLRRPLRRLSHPRRADAGAPTAARPRAGRPPAARRRRAPRATCACLGGHHRHPDLGPAVQVERAHLGGRHLEPAQRRDDRADVRSLGLQRPGVAGQQQVENRGSGVHGGKVTPSRPPDHRPPALVAGGRRRTRSDGGLRRW